LFVYPDQNALIALGRKARNSEARGKLDAVSSSGPVTFVLSLWHLIETTNTNNITNATELARFIDSLKPLWLLDRHDLLKAEIAEDFCRFASTMRQLPARLPSPRCMQDSFVSQMGRGFRFPRSIL
jgi:hypothetical protein